MEAKTTKEQMKQKFDKLIALKKVEMVNHILLGQFPDLNWDVHDIIAKLVEATDILLDQKNYDGHGWEQIHHCREKAREMLKRLRPQNSDENRI